MPDQQATATRPSLTKPKWLLYNVTTHNEHFVRRVEDISER